MTLLFARSSLSWLPGLMQPNTDGPAFSVYLSVEKVRGADVQEQDLDSQVRGIRSIGYVLTLSQARIARTLQCCTNTTVDDWPSRPSTPTIRWRDGNEHDSNGPALAIFSVSDPRNVPGTVSVHRFVVHRQCIEFESLIRVAFIGAGKMARRHLQALERCQTPARAVGIADPNRAAVEAFLSSAGECAAFDSPDDLLAHGNFDVVHVCTPARSHATMASKALTFGFPVYVEKPFATTLVESEELLHMAEDRDLQVCAGHQLLYEEPTRVSESLLQAVGRVVHVESFFSFLPVQTSALSSGEQLLDVLPHPTYLLFHFLGLAGSAEFAEPVVDLDSGGNVHAIVRGIGSDNDGGLTGTLCVTLSGRPVESYLRIVGENGTLHADYVRGTVQRLIGPGSSGIDKALAPYRLARQLRSQTTRALFKRIRRRRLSYPGLVAIFDAFYSSLETGDPAVSHTNITETTRLVERVGTAIEGARRLIETSSRSNGELVAVTGGTGFLGRAVVRELADGKTHRVRVLARRIPAPWECVPGVDYRQCDLAKDDVAAAIEGVAVVVHCAAETAGGWKDHERNSIEAVERLLRAGSEAGISRLIHVSSIAVLASQNGRSIREDSPLQASPRAAGPYVWGKLVSEQSAERLSRELGIELGIVRPAAIIDSTRFDPPGRLGKRLGNLFVAVGNPGEQFGVVELRTAALLISWLAAGVTDSPRVINILEPQLPTRRDLVSLLKRRNPQLRVVWIPRFAVRLIGRMLSGLQRLLRPGEDPVDFAQVFAEHCYDATVARRTLTRGGETGRVAEGGVLSNPDQSAQPS